MKNIVSAENHIGALQELCMSYRHWKRLPEYQYEETRKSRFPWFTAKCLLGKYVTEGEGKSKQEAKKNAACSMLYMVKGLSQHEIASLVQSQNQSNSAHSESVDSANIVKFKDFNSYDVFGEKDEFYRKILQSDKPYINALKSLKSINKLSLDAVEFLKKIGQEHDFDIQYNVITNQQNEVEVNLHADLCPVLNCISKAKTVKEANTEAAHSALVYLKILLECRQ